MNIDNLPVIICAILMGFLFVGICLNVASKIKDQISKTRERESGNPNKE